MSDEQELKDFKRKYYNLIRTMTALERTMCDRCPSMMRNCCAGCNLLRLKIKDIKNGTIYDEEEYVELTSNSK